MSTVNGTWIRAASHKQIVKYLSAPDAWTKFYTYRMVDDKLERVKFKPALLSLALQKVFYPITIVDKTGLSETWAYINKTSTYTNGGEDYLSGWIKKIWKEEFSKPIVEKTIYDIRNTREAQVARKQFKLDWQQIPIRGCILEIYSDEGTYKIRRIENSPEYYVTNRINVEYNPDANAELWDNFIHDIIPADKWDTLQEACGTILYCRTTQKGLALVGPSNTGKTTLTNALTLFLGGTEGINCTAVPLQNLSIPSERARLYKKMANIINEFPAERIRDTAYIKQAITGAFMSARRLYQSSFDFLSYAKIIVATNDLPPVSEDKKSWWNKWEIIKVAKVVFDRDNPERVEDYWRYLVGTEERKSAILNWLLEGLLRYLNSGGRFTNETPWEEVRSMWLCYSDSIGQYMSPENYWVEYGSKNIPKPELWNNYAMFCKVKGIQPTTELGFYREIKNRYINGNNPLIGEAKLDGINHYTGINISTNTEETRDE